MTNFTLHRLLERYSCQVGGTLIVLLMALMSPAQLAASGHYEPKAFFHVDMEELRRFTATLNNVDNMINHYTDQLIDYDIRLVVQAFGIRYVTDERMEDTPFVIDDELAEEMERLRVRDRLRSLVTIHGIKVELCENTMVEAGLKIEDIDIDVTLVPYGATRITELQNAYGFASIKMQ